MLMWPKPANHKHNPVHNNKQLLSYIVVGNKVGFTSYDEAESIGCRFLLMCYGMLMVSNFESRCKHGKVPPTPIMLSRE